MRYIRNISDDQNKSGDTDNIFRFNLLQGEDIFNFGDYPISINIANSSGYILSMVPEKEFGNSVLKLDFNDQSLKSLTPDNYLLEVEVKFPDGTTATFPTKGGMPFTVNSNLKNTAGYLVPTVTFDEVLSAVDKKVNNYLATVVKGDKGDKGEKGDTGVVDTTADYTWAGTNTFTQQINGSLRTRYVPVFDFNTLASDTKKYSGLWFVGDTNVVNGPTGDVTWGTIEVIAGNTYTTGFIRYTRFLTGETYMTGVNGNIMGWYKVAKDDTVVHNTGTETVSGDKTFNGNNSFTQLVNGALNSTRLVPFTDFYDVANGNMIKYAGLWFTQTKDQRISPYSPLPHRKNQ